MSVGPSFPRRSSRSSILWMFLVAAGFFGAALLCRPWSPKPAKLEPDEAMRSVIPRGDLAAVEKTTIAIFRKNSPSVVHITTLINAVTDDFGFDVQQVPEGTGSGFVWDKKGRIVTNFHVIRGADVAQVVLADHSMWKARLVGASPEGDLAVLSIEAPEDRLLPIQIGTSHDLQVGQSVFAIGNPFGLDHTLTTGIVSALGARSAATRDERSKA